MADSKNKRVLITGGAGFIGSHTADALIMNGYQVRILDNLDPQVHGPSGEFPSYLNPEIECIKGDIRSEEDLSKSLKDVRYVYHFASLTGVGQSMYDLKSYTDTNVNGTANLIETLIKNKNKIKKLVLSSSRAVYGEGTQLCSDCGIVYPSTRKREDLEKGDFECKCPICERTTSAIITKEDRPLMPTSLYGWTKKAQEDLFNYASETFGINIAILRYFNVYGSRQSLINPYTGIVSIFYGRLKESQPISIYEDDRPIRDFIHVSDVVQGNLKAIEEKNPDSFTVNIGSGKNTSISNIANGLAKVLNKKTDLISKGEFRIGDILSCTADISRAKELLDFKPKTSLEEGMKEFVGWAKNERSIDLYQKAIEELNSHSLFSKSSENGK